MKTTLFLALVLTLRAFGTPAGPECPAQLPNAPENFCVACHRGPDAAGWLAEDIEESCPSAYPQCELPEFPSPGFLITVPCTDGNGGHPGDAPPAASPEAPPTSPPPGSPPTTPPTQPPTTPTIPSSPCGNRQLDSGEQCDDGNAKNGDGCNSSCQVETVCP